MKKGLIGLVGAFTLGLGYHLLKPHLPSFGLVILAIVFIFAVRFAAEKWK